MIESGIGATVQLSVLVVSRTAERLSTLLSSVSAATSLSAQDVEILCSWNGSEDDEQLIENHSGYEFFIAQRKPYHFAANINQLANHASGDVVALVNDDVVLDPGSLDAGLACLSEHPPATLVGGLLRTPDEQLQHAGFSFELNHNPYHILEGMIAAGDFVNDQTAFEVPAVTAAVALIPRQTFLQLSLNENYQRCGEDVEFNLDLRQKLNGHVFLCPGLVVSTPKVQHVLSRVKQETPRKIRSNSGRDDDTLLNRQALISYASSWR